MAEKRQWIRHIESFVDSSAPPTKQTASLDAIVSLLKNDVLTIKSLVREMEMYLTTTDNFIRAKGILFLAELLARLASKPLDKATLHSLIVFFTERLADWNAIHGALVGCLALMRRKNDVGAITDSEARSVVQSFLQNIQVQSLRQHDRKLCFEVLECLLHCFCDAVAFLDDSFVYGICEAIDGENDPQCLLLAFRVIELLARLQSDSSDSLANFAGDLFGILDSYFPIHFMHHSVEDIDIKRDDLSKALMLAFSSTPFFEPFAVPLLLEKLSSSLPLAKVDSLKYLTSCTVNYGAHRMAKYANAIWSSIKESIFTSRLNPVLTFELGSHDGMACEDNEMATEALILLQNVIMQNSTIFLGLLAGDEDINIVIKTIVSYRSFSDIPSQEMQKLYAVGCILSVFAKTTIASCSGLFERFFPCLMDSLGLSVKDLSEDCFEDENGIHLERLNFGALYLSVELLSSCRDLILGNEDITSKIFCGHEKLHFMLHRHSNPLSKAFSSRLVTSGNHVGHDLDFYVGVRGLQIIATFPVVLIPIPKAMFENILMRLMSCITVDFDKALLWKLALTALVQIGSFIERFNESEKGISYESKVVENIVSLITIDDFGPPFSLKLEALYHVGTSGLKFIPKMVQGLEKSIFANLFEVHENLMSVNITIQLLQCYYDKVLPWLHKIGGFEDIPLRFAVNIWNQIRDNTLSCSHFQEKVLLDATMMAMKLAVVICSGESQSAVVEKAYGVLSSSTSFPLNKSMTFTDSFQTKKLHSALCLDRFSWSDEWLLSLFSSVVLALRPQTNILNVRSILNLLMSATLLGHVPAAQALGSILNKLPLKLNGVDIQSDLSLEEALNIILDRSLWNFNDNVPVRRYIVVSEGSEIRHANSILLQRHAIVGLSWIGKGLLMRGHEKVKDITMILLRCLLSDVTEGILSLNHCSLENSDEKDLISSMRKSAAHAFDILMSDSEICLNKRFHAIVRPLYKQRFFSTMMPVLLSSVAQSDSSTTRLMLCRVIARLISNTPIAAILNEAPKIVPVLVECLSMLREDTTDKDLIYDILLVLSGILTDTNGKEVATDNSDTIINALIGLVSYPHRMFVRETAIQCLIATSEFPHIKIYPFRTKVLLNISKALDDPKWAVRQEALRCQKAWSSIAQKSSR